MSAWEYEAPTTMFESEPFGEACLAAEGRARQKGDVDFLSMGQLKIVLLVAVAWGSNRTRMILRYRHNRVSRTCSDPGKTRC